MNSPSLHDYASRKNFYCTECHKYFDIVLNMALEGWFRIHCPNSACRHIHYRKVQNGEITEERFTDKDWRNDQYIVEDIIAMPSSCRDENTEKADLPGAEGFVARLWHEYFGAKA